MTELKYTTLDNYDASRTLRQHIFKRRISKVPYTDEEYEGNISLCGKIRVVEDNELDVNFDELDDEDEKNNCCKLCKRVKINYEKSIQHRR